MVTARLMQVLSRASGAQKQSSRPFNSLPRNIRGSGVMGWDNANSVGADLRVCPEAAGTRDRGRHAGLPLRPTPLPYYHIR